MLHKSPSTADPSQDVRTIAVVVVVVLVVVIGVHTPVSHTPVLLPEMSHRFPDDAVSPKQNPSLQKPML